MQNPISKESSARFASYELDILNICIHLAQKENTGNVLSDATSEDTSFKEELSSLISLLYYKRISNCSIEESIGFFTFLLMKCVVEQSKNLALHSLNPDNHIDNSALLQDLLAESLHMSQIQEDYDYYCQSLNKSKGSTDGTEPEQI